MRKNVTIPQFYLKEVISDAQASAYPIIHALDPYATDVGIVYKTGVFGNSQFFETITLDQSDIPKKYPCFNVNSTHFIFAVPSNGRFGWMVSSEIITDFTQPVSDKLGSSYNTFTDVTFSAMNLYSTAPASATVKVVATISAVPVVAEAVEFYDPTLSLSNQSGVVNVVRFDPRVWFDGAIDGFTIKPEFDTDTINVTDQFVNQSTFSTATTVSSVNQMVSGSNWIFIQSSKMLTI